MSYTSQTFHAGVKPSAVAVNNADQLVTALTNINTTLVAVGDVTSAAAATAAALTGTLTGTLDQSLADVSGAWDATAIATINKNFKEVQDEITKLLADIAAIRTAVNAVITATAG